MKVDILLISVLNFKKEDRESTRLSYIFTGNQTLSDTTKFKGYVEQATYYDGLDVFNKFTPDCFGQIAEASITEIKDERNPMKSRRMISEIRLKNSGKIIRLLQSQ